MSELASLHAVVHGLVQGVYFRSFVARNARALGLTGCVRNLPGGRVDVVSEGEREKLEELLRQIEDGPPFARVDGVDVDWSEYRGTFGRFEVR